jgi:hypothetical protein
MKTMGACVLLLTGLCFAQYQKAYTWEATDMSSYLPTHNAWKPLPRTIHCKPNTLSFGADRLLGCINSADDYVYTYQWTPLSPGTWTKQTGMGTSVAGLAISDANNIFARLSTSAIVKWSGSQWISQGGGSLSQLTVAVDDYTLVGTNSGSIYKYPVGGPWIAIASGGYTFASGLDPDNICGVSGGQIYFNSTKDSSMHLFSPQPGSGVTACYITEDGYYVAYGSFGTSLFNFSSQSWSTIYGSVIPQAASEKSLILGLDSSGAPYHLNVIAATISLHLTGVQGCFDSPCPPGTTHNLSEQVTLPGGLFGQQVTQSIPPTQAANLTAYDTSLGCDPFFGDPADPSCNPVNHEALVCSFIGTHFQSVGGPPPPISTLKRGAIRAAFAQFAVK